MGGTNPYIEEVEYDLPTKKYKLTFMPMNVTIEVDPEKLPYSRTGLMGSILEISSAAHDLDVDIEHTCGGVCACSTCHIVVREGLDTCNEATDAEMDQLDNAPGLEINSRLACQCIPNGTKDVVVEIPEWNRNAVKEVPHH